MLELTHNWDTHAYDLGNGFGHIAVEVDDAYQACAEVKRLGGKVSREAGPMKHGTTVIAFVEDPDGYKIEFIQKKILNQPGSHGILNCGGGLSGKLRQLAVAVCNSSSSNTRRNTADG